MNNLSSYLSLYSFLFLKQQTLQKVLFIWTKSFFFNSVDKSSFRHDKPFFFYVLSS